MKVKQGTALFTPGHIRYKIQLTVFQHLQALLPLAGLPLKLPVIACGQGFQHSGKDAVGLAGLVDIQLGRVLVDGCPHSLRLRGIGERQQTTHQQHGWKTIYPCVREHIRSFHEGYVQQPRQIYTHA
ncbi:MAG: hypothetical protein WAV92_03020 [Halopseudomonas yangmingensis]